MARRHGYKSESFEGGHKARPFCEAEGRNHDGPYSPFYADEPIPRIPIGITFSQAGVASCCESTL